jgi:calmodulin
MDELSEDQIEEFREAFSLFDIDGSGYIQTKELGTVLRSLGIHFTEEEMNDFILKYDSNGDNIIHFKDFLEILMIKTAESKPEEELREALKLFDPERKHYLEVEHLKKDFKAINPKIDSYQLNEIIEQLKTDGENIKIDETVEKVYNKIKSYVN